MIQKSEGKQEIKIVLDQFHKEENKTDLDDEEGKSKPLHQKIKSIQPTMNQQHKSR